MHPAAKALDSQLSTKALRASLHQQLEAYTRSQLIVLQPTFAAITGIHRRQLTVPTKPLTVRHR